MLIIEQIRSEHTWRLRRDVLYPGKMMIEMELNEDADGMHFGAYKDNNIVGVISLFHNHAEYQFRKLAVTSDMQNKGIGSALLNQVIKQATEDGGTKLWCNARVNAIGFYLKAGFTQTGRLFTKNGIDYEIMEKVIAV